MDSVYATKPKKKAKENGGIIVYEDEASFRQNPTLHQTWAAIGEQPVVPSKGQRNSQKVFGAIAPKTAESVFRIQKEYFNHQTYILFLEEVLVPAFWKKGGGKIFLIQDNASYHKKEETYAWFKQNRKYIEVQCLPAYHPELNAAEKLWWHTRKETTHNRYHEKEEMLRNALESTFSKIVKQPESIKSLVRKYL